MHHIARCTSCIAHFDVAHLLHIWVDHVEPRTEDQVEQVQWVFEDPQASNYEDTNNYLGSRQDPVHPTKVLVLYI
jgi:hypothetical protein